MSLKVKTARSSMIMGVVLLIQRPLDFIVSIILARLLEPRDFGLVSLVMILLITSNLFSSLGMNQALIYTKHERNKIAFPAFVIIMTTGLLLFLLVQLNVQGLAWVLGNPETVPLLRWLSGLILLNAMTTVPMSLLRKELQFERVGLSQLVAEFAYAGIVLWLAYAGYGVWSLVWASLLKMVVTNIILWSLYPGWEISQPSRWDWPVLKELLRYGWQSMTGGLVAYFVIHTDDWAVGRFLGAKSLGFYSQAYNFTNSTLGYLSKNVITTVFFPSYVKMQDDKERLGRAYLKSVELVWLLMVPMAFGMFVLAHEIVAVVLGAKWLPMVATLQVYSLMLLSRPISENSAPLFQAVGLPSYNTRSGFVFLGVEVALIFALINMGFVGVAIAVVVSDYVGVAYNIYQVNSILPGTARKTLQSALPIVAAGVVMLAGVYFAKPLVATLLGGLLNVPSLITLILIGVLIYGGISYFTQRELTTEVLGLLAKGFSRNKKRREKQSVLVSVEATEN